MGAQGALILAAVLSGLPGAALAKPKRTSGQAPDTDPPAITHDRVESAIRGEVVVIRARIEDPSGVFAPAVYVRPVGKSEYQTFAMDPSGDLYATSIPRENVMGDFEYFIEAFDQEGNGPAREASPEAPVRVRVAAPEPRNERATHPEKSPPRRVLPPRVATPPVKATQNAPPLAPAVPTEGARGRGREGGDSILETWWFWTLLGAAAGATAAVAIVLGNRGAPLDTVDIAVSGPDPTRGLP